MNTDKITTVFGENGLEIGVACIAPHKNDAGIQLGTEVLTEHANELITADGDDLLVVTIERHTTRQYKDWWADDVEAAQIANYHGLVVSLATIPGGSVDAEWFEKFDSDGGKMFINTD